MKNVARRVCGDCGIGLPDTERYWTHVTSGGRKIDSYCEDCMYAQVAGYAQRTIMGMLDGSIPTVVKAVVRGSWNEGKGEGTEP